MTRLITLAILGVLLTLFSPSAVLADSSLVCTQTDCTLNPEGPLFFVSNIIPGDTVQTTLTVSNASDSDGFFEMDTQRIEDSHLGQMLTISLTRNAVALLPEQRLEDFFTTNPVVSLPLAAKETASFVFTVHYPKESGNQAKQSRVVFDLPLSFSLADTPTAPSTPQADTTPSDSQTTPSTPSVLGTTCDASSPTAIPVLSVISRAPTQLTLEWTSAEPVTHYALLFGTQPATYLYGNSDVGKSTRYTVTNLASNGQYFFAVQAINGCAPGPLSNEVVSGSAVVTAPLNPPAGFSEGDILGVATESSTLEETVMKPEAPTSAANFGEVLGAVQYVESCTDSLWKWVIVLCFALAALGSAVLWQSMERLLFWGVVWFGGAVTIFALLIFFCDWVLAAFCVLLLTMLSTLVQSVVPLFATANLNEKDPSV